MLLRCGATDLFGGARIGGYAVCDTEARRFTRAVDDNAFDGDPALEIDFPARRIHWRDPGPGAELTIALSNVRPYSAPNQQDVSASSRAALSGATPRP